MIPWNLRVVQRNGSSQSDPSVLGPEIRTEKYSVDTVEPVHERKKVGLLDQTSYSSDPLKTSSILQITTVTFSV